MWIYTTMTLFSHHAKSDGDDTTVTFCFSDFNVVWAANNSFLFWGNSRGFVAQKDKATHFLTSISTEMHASCLDSDRFSRLFSCNRQFVRQQPCWKGSRKTGGGIFCALTCTCCQEGWQTYREREASVSAEEVCHHSLSPSHGPLCFSAVFIFKNKKPFGDSN